MQDLDRNGQDLVTMMDCSTIVVWVMTSVLWSLIIALDGPECAVFL